MRIHCFVVSFLLLILVAAFALGQSAASEGPWFATFFSGSDLPTRQTLAQNFAVSDANSTPSLYVRASTSAPTYSYTLAATHGDSQGYSSMALQQYYNGVKMKGCSFAYTIDNLTNQVDTTDDSSCISPSLSTSPGLTAQQALDTSFADLAANGAYIANPAADLVIYRSPEDLYFLAYDVYSLDGKNSDSGVTEEIIDANTGVVLDRNLDPMFIPDNTPPEYPNAPCISTSSQFSLLSRSSQKLRYSGANAFLVGYYDFHIITGNNVYRGPYFKRTKGQNNNPNINFQRIFVYGYANVAGCFSTCDCPNVETLPFPKVNGKYQICTQQGCGGAVSIQLNPLYWGDASHPGRLRPTLNLALANGQIVLLTLFDRLSLNESFWNPLNSNMPKCTGAYDGSCLPTTSLLPSFYNLTLNPVAGDPDGVNKIGQIQRAYVQQVMSVVRQYPNVVVEIMNEAQETGPVATFADWHDKIAKWVKAASGNGFLVAANPLSGRIDQPLTSYFTAVFNKPSIDVMSLHFRQWASSPPQEAKIEDVLTKYSSFCKPIVLDDDGSREKADINNDLNNRSNNQNVSDWVNKVRTVVTQTGNMGKMQFLHLDQPRDIKESCLHCLDCQALHTFRDVGSKTSVAITSGSRDNSYCQTATVDLCPGVQPTP